MDIEFIKSIISPNNGKDKRLIMRGDCIDSELLDLLAKAKTNDMLNAFYKYDKNPKKEESFYIVKLHCKKCGCEYSENASKTRVVEIVRSVRDGSVNKNISFCEKCKDEIKRKEKEERDKYTEDCKAQYRSETMKYINYYVNPNREFLKGLKANQKISIIMKNGFWDKYWLDDNMVEKSVKELKYSDFLETPYWEGVRNYKLKKSNYSCELCSKKGIILQVHHKKYDRHGEEHIRSVADKDLIVLCSDCHKKFHDIVM